jgi:hypothetical protein
VAPRRRHRQRPLLPLLRLPPCRHRRQRLQQQRLPGVLHAVLQALALLLSRRRRPRGAARRHVMWLVAAVVVASQQPQHLHLLLLLLLV